MTYHLARLSPSSYIILHDYFLEPQTLSHNQIHTPLIQEILLLCPQTSLSILYHRIWEWTSFCLPNLSLTEQASLQEYLSKNQDMRERLTTVFASYLIPPSLHYINVQESSNSINSEPQLALPSPKQVISPLLSDTLLDKLSKMRSQAALSRK